jgi:DNA-binding NarL/FixJ family response regulator
MTETVAVRATIVDSRPLFRDAIRACLTKGGYVVLSQARDFDEAMRQADSLHPDLMIVGPHLAESSLTVCREIVIHLPTVKVILFTAHADEVLFQADAVHAGVASCLRPESTTDECLAVIAKVMAGHQFFSNEILSLAFEPIKLTARELAVLRLMAEGKSDREIAATLGVTISTIRNHTQHILEKLNVHHRQALWRARSRGLI